MLLDREWAGVELLAENPDVGDISRPETTDGERKELGNNLRRRLEGSSREIDYRITYTTDGDRRISEEEELIQTGDQDGPNDSDEPSTNGGDRDVRVVRVRDGGTDFRIWRVVLCKDSSTMRITTSKRRTNNAPRTPAMASSRSMLGSSKSAIAMASAVATSGTAFSGSFSPEEERMLF